MKRVLIVTPNWPPISCPDMHRVRMSLRFFGDFGWEPLILKVNPDEQEGIKDKDLSKTIPDYIKTCQADCFNKVWTSWLGIKSVGLRSFFHLAQLGSEIIESAKPNLVFFSTTMFHVMSLGRYWHSKYNLPYVLDFQDPWVNDYYRLPDAPLPPGGKFKYGLSQAIAQALESWTLRQVSHVISVSPEYRKTILQRYPHLRPEQFTVLPFGAPETDFEQLPGLNIQQKIFDPNDGKRHWVYVGRGGNDMALALRTLFLGIQFERQRNPEQWRSVQLHFVGTSYAPSYRAVKTVEPIAQELGVADLVTEHEHRIPYFEALQVLADSDAILLIGSNDSGYTASKLYPCILARKPILAIFHHQSSVVDILHHTQAGGSVTFTAENQPEDLLAEVTIQLLELLSLPKGYQPKTNWEAFQPYTAREMTRTQCAIFDRCLTKSL
jgi:hypothetical protein